MHGGHFKPLPNSKLPLFNTRCLQLDFQFERTTTSYPAWIKTIASLAPDFLSPSSNDLWNCPDIVDFTLLTKSIELEKSGSTEHFIPTTAKSTHSEATLV
ncbi:hypothetical protein PCANC_24113 [Puccinia coronata f. sp. avenae]|uniref:Uncharacterized protein n=1 Tax=Puccinia coronata f. sp. avenae TaxID=200324 RepID=A0A2N5SQR6_9BASI|nr:hypothetical protein PCANC_24113 [Puccinia coronata f. sp. avenae]